RAAAGVIADRQRRASAAASPRRKRHVDGALRVTGEGGGAVVGLGKVAAVGPGDVNTADGHGRTAGVGNRHGLSRAGGVNLLVAERQRRGRKRWGEDTCEVESHRHLVWGVVRVIADRQRRAAAPGGGGGE